MALNKIIVAAMLMIVVFAFAISPGQQDTGADGKNIVKHSSIVTPSDPYSALFMMATAQEGTNEDTEVTVYNQDLALVKEKRNVDLDAGYNSIEYVDVASRIDPTSVMFEDTRYPDTFVAEQNYQYDLVSSSKLLDKYLDKEISVTDSDGTTYTGTLLSHGNGIVLKTDGGVVSLTDISKIEYPDAAGLLTKPTLVWQVYSPIAGSRDVLTSYLTGGMSWKANYIVKTNAADTKADVTAWVSIDNKAGTSFNNAKLKLVAGDIHRVYDRPIPYPKYAYAEEAVAMDAPTAFAEESLFEYHLYTLDRTTTLKNNEIKQISLLSADDVPVNKEFIFDGTQDSKVRVVLEMTNSEDMGLGMPLPKGVVRVYKADTSGQLQFLGEDEIDHTAEDEDVRVFVGNAFDITGERKQTDYQRISEDVYRVSNEITIKNHKSESVDIVVVEHLYGDWDIITTSDTYTKKDSRTIEYRISVPADGTKTVSYTVEYTY